MPKSLGKVLNDFATKAGIANDNPALISFLQNKELATIEIPDELLTAMEGNLHSLDSAGANQQLKNKLWAQAYNGLDTEMKRMMDEEAFDDATKMALNSETSSTKRAVQLIKKIKELEAAKSKAAPADKKELTDQINAANQKLSDVVKANKEALEAQAATHEQEITDLMYSNHLNLYNLHVPEGFSKEDIIMLAGNKLKTAMREAGELRITRKNGQLELVKPDGTDYYDNKTQLKKDIKSFTESTLAQHKLLQTTATGTSGTGNSSTPATLPGTPAMKPADAQLISNIDQRIAAEMAKQ